MPNHYVRGGGGGGAESFPIVYELVFTNRETKQQIRMHVPGAGIFHDPRRKTTKRDLVKLSNAITDVLREVLDTPKGARK
jgi:hypothetical protein